jgi:F-type H+-transporting ATPase subunit b
MAGEEQHEVPAAPGGELSPAGELHEGTVAPGGEAHAAEGGLPQMDFATYPSQLFWLVLTFGFLLVFLSKYALPRIGGAIQNRQSTIAGDLESADRLRKDAHEALKGYENALGSARGRAVALADESRKVISAEVEKLKHAAEADAQRTLTAAESRIAETRKAAAAHVRTAAADAASDIVERLIGERVSPADAARAIGS